MINVTYPATFPLSPHFTLGELVQSDVARQKCIDNHPDNVVLAHLLALAVWTLEPLRAAARRPLHINSGYRCRALNEAVGGSPTSQHLLGEAADIRCKDRAEALALADLLADPNPNADIDFDQAIVEHNATGTYWLHVSCKLLKRNNRRQVIRDLQKK